VSQTVGGQTTTYQYEGMGNLIGVTLPDGTQIEYLLDALDQRVGRKVNGTLTQAFLYQDSLRPIAELDGAGTVVSRFVYATRGSVPEYMIKGGVTYAIITDHLGSPRLVLDAATGEIAQRMEHDEFGHVTLDTNPGFQPFGFGGGIYDRQTGLVHFGAREYDAETGRWTTKDPIGFLGGDANLYAYVLNDPINNVDPFGLQAPPSYLAAAMISAEYAAAIGLAVNYGRQAAQYGRQTAQGIGAFGARVGQGLANAGQSVRNFFCSSPGSNPQQAQRIVPQGAERVVNAVRTSGGGLINPRLQTHFQQTMASARTLAADERYRMAEEWFERQLAASRDWRYSLPTVEEQAEAFSLLVELFNRLAGFGL
jgi:RHS repeat-associated protein